MPNENKLPQISPEQRAENLRLAAAARRLRAEAKQAIAHGDLDPVEVLNGDDEGLQRMHAFEFLTSCPHIGGAGARRILTALGIAESRRLKGLGSRQRERLSCVLSRIASGSPVTLALRAAGAIE